MVGKKHKKDSKVLIYIEHSIIFVSAITGHVSMSAFASVIGIPMGIKSTVVGLKTCAVTAGIRKYNSIIKKKRKNNEIIVSLARVKLSAIEALISKDLINWYISHDEFASMNNVLKEYNDTKEAHKNPNNW